MLYIKQNSIKSWKIVLDYSLLDVSTYHSPTKPTHSQNCAKSLHLNHSIKTIFLKYTSLLKILKTPIHNPTEKHLDSWL